MKILFILDLYKPHIWWAEILFENIITRLADKWHKISILTTKFSKDVLSYEKLSENIEIYRVGHNRYDFMFYSLFKWIKLAKKVDIIHTTTYNSAISASIIWKITWKKVVLTIHEIFGKLWYKFMWWKWFFFKMFEDLIFKFSFAKYICVSNYTKNSLRISYNISDLKLITVYNWIDYKLWSKKVYKEDKVKDICNKYKLEKYFVWLYYWRPGVSKWLEYYINTIPDIVDIIPNFKAFLIIPKNDIDRIQYIKKIIKKLNIDKYIIWISSVEYNELWNYILASNFVIVPSLAEWFWFAAAEVCSLEQNLIVSNIASLPEVVSWKINFIEPWSIDSIKKWVENFYNNRYIEIPKKKFRWSDNINKTLETYKDVLWK